LPVKLIPHPPKYHYRPHQFNERGRENLLELRQFRPNEPVNVIIKPVELNLLEMAAYRLNNEGTPAPATNQDLDAENQAENEEDGFLTLTEEAEGSTPPPCKVIREFKL